MFTLIGIGVGAAYGYSAWPRSRRPVSRRLPDARCRRAYFDTTVVIIVLVLLGQVLELRARDRTGAAIRALLALAPNHRARRRATAGSTTFRWTRCKPATSCGSGPARRFRWMA